MSEILCKAQKNEKPRNLPHEPVSGLYDSKLVHTCIFCGVALDFERKLEFPEFIPRYEFCETCRGRGEVAAGITFTDAFGNIRVEVNPDAVYVIEDGRGNSKLDISIIEENPLVPLWGIAFCQKCHGTGLKPLKLGDIGR